MPEWRIVVTRSFEKDFRSLPREVRERILPALERLQADPHTARKLVAVRIGQWRLRVGDYRIRYDIMGADVVLYRVRHRKDAYADR